MAIGGKMFIKSCPKCGRMPKIKEVVSFKEGTRRYFIGCPNYCSVIMPKKDCRRWELRWFNSSFLEVSGNPDHNEIYKAWNDAIKE